jgi:hypothetical protein
VRLQTASSGGGGRADGRADILYVKAIKEKEEAISGNSKQASSVDI